MPTRTLRWLSGLWCAASTLCAQRRLGLPLSLLVAVLLALPASSAAEDEVLIDAAEDEVLIDFEEFVGPFIFTGIEPPLTVHDATFSGGQILTEAKAMPANQTSIYGTAFFCPGCLPAITADFGVPVSNVSMQVLNGWIVPITYTIEDDRGGQVTVTLPPNFQSGAAVVSLPSSGITQVTVTGSDGAEWDFFIDNIRYTPSQGIEITLDPEPDDEGRYVIDSTPMMPLIKAIPEIVGITPDPTPETTFTWEASLAIDRPCPGVPCELLFDDDIRQDVETEGEDPYQLELLDQSQLRGGRLKIAASATVDGAELTGERGADEDDELKVVGTNPQRAHIQNEIETGVGGAMGGLDGDEVADALKRIACHESGQRQFDVAADGGIGDVCLTFDNGIGIFQITNTNNCPRPAYESCRHVLFDWRANVAEGLASFGSKVVSARNYPENLRTSTAYRQYIERAINPQRVTEGLEEPITGTPAPDFTMTGRLGDEPPNQVLEDAVRGYHGYGCNATPWEGLLHEFTPDDHFLIHVPDEELPELDVDPRVWRRVNPVERTPACEVPDYVDLVIGRTAACAVDWPDNRPRCRTW